MHAAVETVGIVNLVLFVAIAAVCLRQWWSYRAETSFWAATAFVSLGIVVVAGRIIAADPDTLLEKVAQRVDLALFLLFPYFLYRFAAAFGPQRRPLARFVDSLSALLVAATVSLPYFPAEGESWPWWFVVYVVAFLVHWTVLLLIVAWRLWRAGRHEGAVARRRMRLLAFASTVIALVLLASLGAGEDSLHAFVTGVFGTASGVAFLLAFAPPPALRLLWRRPEQVRMQRVTAELLAAAEARDVVARVLPPLASIVGARGIALEDDQGRVVGSHGDLDGADGDLTDVTFPFGRLVVRTSQFAPFFGDDERALLTAVGSLIGISLDRARLFAQEREAREALERADQLKSEFVALAAHELRSPVSAIYGLSQTLEQHAARLDPTRLAELQRTLVEQIARLRELVEQLLDLSRLDADAVRISPQRVRIRERLERIAENASPLAQVPIVVDADPALEAEVDVDALDRIVSNLVVNACRYGEPPVVISASAADGRLVIVVEDQGPGVPAEFVPQLFDRFARSSPSAATVPTGTGLGLAIARSYARAHHGEVSYRPAAPRGAAFELTLPVLTAA